MVDFNTSYVLVQEDKELKMVSKVYNFNTSYVLVQDTNKSVRCNSYSISIHHMFWFKVASVEQLETLVKDFNTSYVLVQGIKLWKRNGI